MPGLLPMQTFEDENGNDSLLCVSAPRVSIAWGRGNRLRLTYLNQPRHQEEAMAEPSNKVVEVKVGSSHDDGVSGRKLAYDSITPFAMLQGRKQAFLHSGEHLPPEWWESVLEYSRNVSAILGPSKDLTGAAVKQLFKTKKEMEEPSLLKAIWDLLEIFYVDKHALSWLPEQLVGWMQSYNRVLSQGKQTIYTKLVSLQLKLVAIRFPEDDKEYWDGIVSALAVGWLDVVVKLLRMHGSYQHDQIDSRQIENGLVEAVAVLISKMPRLRSSLSDEELGMTYTFKPEFSKAWERWRNQIVKLNGSNYWLECSHEYTLNGLKRVLLVLLGDMDTLVEATTHWMELLVSHFLFIRPFSVASEGILSLARKCIHAKSFSENDELLDLVLAIIGENIEVVIADCSKLFGPWMLTHVTELLSARDLQARAILSEERDALGGLNIDELNKIIYSQLLSSHSCTWQLTPPYLAACPQQGRGLLEHVLLIQPIGNHHHFLKVLDICRMYELWSVADKLMKRMGVHSWKHGRKGIGISWLQKAHDNICLSAAANELLSSVLSAIRDCTKLQEIEGFIDLLGPQFEGCGGLAFLHRYKDFIVALQNFKDAQVSSSGNDKALAAGKDAVKSLMQLIRGGSVPSQFLVQLLDDSVELLEYQGEVLVSVVETSILLVKLQALILSSETLPDNKDLQLYSPQSLSRVRLAIASNLGRAILKE